MLLLRLRRWSVLPVFLAALTPLAPACSDPHGSCAILPELTASDLACESDDDCTEVWSGIVCACGCYCPDTAANAAAYARAESSISSLPRDSSCSLDSCGCPATAIARCVAHQCTSCGNPEFGALPGEPAACSGDAGVNDGG